MYKAIVIGTSAGGIQVLSVILPALPAGLPVPVMVVQHISPGSDNYLVELFNRKTKMPVLEAEDKATPEVSHIYMASPGYHLLIEPDTSFSLSLDERVNFSRPSIDVLFETACDAFKGQLIGVLLTGANFDGVTGLYKIHQAGGFTIIQDPATAEVDTMPKKTLDYFQPDKILAPDKIPRELVRLVNRS